MTDPIQPAPGGSPSDADIRALASQLTAMASTGPPLVINQGNVVDVNPDDTPPTCSVTMSGSANQVDGVRYLDSYTPFIGDTVAILKQNASALIIGHVADIGTSSQSAAGWVASSMSGVFFRRVQDHGAWKVQFMGNGSASGTSLFTLPDTPISHRPSVQRVMPISFGANADSRLIVNTNGTVTLQQALSVVDDEAGAVQTSDPAPTGGNSDPSYLTGSAPGHSHTMGHRHWMGGHDHGLALTFSHTIWFDNIEFFL